MVLELTSKNFENEVLKESSRKVIVDFWAQWCGPCRAQGPIIEQLDDAMEGKIKVCKLNVDDEDDIAAMFGIMSIPTLIVFEEGKPVKTVKGLHSLDDLKKLVE